MPETPDFDRLALAIVHASESRIVEQLRHVWNARGAADRAAIESSLASQMGGTASGPYVKNLDRALTALDR